MSGKNNDKTPDKHSDEYRCPNCKALVIQECKVPWICVLNPRSFVNRWN
jgi:hypothetical protein